MSPRRKKEYVISLCRAILVVEQEPILKSERARCKEIAEKFEESKRNLDYFREVSEPAFSRWFHSHFGEKATELRNLDSLYNELRHLVTCVEQEAFLSGCSLRTAYERIERAKQGRAEQEDINRARESEPEFSSSSFGDSDDLPPGLEQELRMHFEDLFGRETPKNKAQFRAEFSAFKQDFREEVLGLHGQGDRVFRDEDQGTRPQKADPTEQRRKQIYRILARQLHPDVNSNLSSQQKDLWNEAQLAYDTHDLDRLETLLAICESGDFAEGGMGFEGIRSLSRLRSIFVDFSKKLKATQKAMREMKKSPAWEFARAEKEIKKLNELTRRIHREMDESKSALQFEVEDLKRMIEQWSRPKKKRGGAKRPRQRSRSYWVDADI